MTRQDPKDFGLADGSNAIDVGTPLPGINERFVGQGPDLGAFERGCPTPIHGPRPEGQEAVTNLIDCSANDPNPGSGSGGGGGAGGSNGPGGGGPGGAGGTGAGNGAEPGDDGSCACRVPEGGRAESSASFLIGIGGLLALGLRRRIRTSRRR